MFNYNPHSLRRRIQAESQPLSAEFVRECISTIRHHVDCFSEDNQKELNEAWGVFTDAMKTELIRCLLDSVSGLCSQCTHHRDNGSSDRDVREALQSKFDFLNQRFICNWVKRSSYAGKYNDWMRNAKEKLIPLPDAVPVTVIPAQTQQKPSWWSNIFSWWSGTPAAAPLANAGTARYVPYRPAY